MNTSHLHTGTELLCVPMGRIPDVMPQTLFELVGLVQERLKGIDFGNITLRIMPEYAAFYNPKSFNLAYDARYLYHESESAPKPFDGPGERKWESNKFPTRFSFLLRDAREYFPGTGFQMIGIRYNGGYFILYDLPRAS